MQYLATSRADRFGAAEERNEKKEREKKMQLSSAEISFLSLCLVLPLQAAILPQAADAEADADTGYLELKPNGTLLLSSASNAGAGNLQNLLLLRSVLQALKLTPGQGEGKLNIKIYGDGVEHKFPPVVENIIQRIQTYFSIYRYTDTSRPLRPDERSTTTTEQPIAESTMQTVESLVIKQEQEQKQKEEAQKKKEQQQKEETQKKKEQQQKEETQKRKEQKQRDQKQKEQKLKPKPQQEDKWITVGESEEEEQKLTTQQPQVEDKWITVGENE